MKAIILLLLVFSACYVNQGNSGGYPTTIIITRTVPYCGGAAPSEKQVKESQERRIPFGTFFYLITGNVNNAGRKIISKFKMDSTGSARLTLKNGDYSIINEFSFQKLTLDSTKSDITCLKNLWATPMISFQVSNKKSDTVRYNIVENCGYSQPCSNSLNLEVPMETSSQNNDN